MRISYLVQYLIVVSVAGQIQRIIEGRHGHKQKQDYKQEPYCFSDFSLGFFSIVAISEFLSFNLPAG